MLVGYAYFFERLCKMKKTFSHQRFVSENCKDSDFQIWKYSTLPDFWNFWKKGHFDCIIKDSWGEFKYRQWLETRFCARNNRCSDLHVLTIELTSHNLSSMDPLLHHISCNKFVITLVSFIFRYFSIIFLRFPSTFHFSKN